MSLVKCPDCGKTVSTRFPVHICTTKEVALKEVVPVKKGDIVHDIAYSLMRFGKNDWEGTRRYLQQASDKLDRWLLAQHKKA